MKEEWMESRQLEYVTKVLGSYKVEERELGRNYTLKQSSSVWLGIL